MKIKFYSIKKIVFILLNVLLSISQIHGQTIESSVSVIPSTNILFKSSIVRSYKYDIVVSYNENSSGNEFFLYDATGILQVLRLDSTMRIKDFQFLHDTIFFCGSYGNEGMMGYFDLQEFYSTTPSLMYFTYSYTNTITKMVAFDLFTPGDIRLTAVGAKSSSISPVHEPDETYLIDCTRVAGIWKMQKLNASGEGTILNWLGAFTDITVTDNYVVTVGPKKYASASSTGQIWICRIKKNDLSGAFYRCLINTDYDLETSSTMKIEHLKNDDVATAVLDINNTFGTIIRVFDIHTLINTNAQRIQIVQKHSPKDLRYIPQYGKLLLLQDDELAPSNIESYVYELDPYVNVHYNTFSYFVSGFNLESLTCYENHGFISAGDLSNHDAYFYKNLGYQADEKCYTARRPNVDIISLRNIDTISLHLLENQIHWNLDYIKHNKSKLDINCQNKK